MIVDETGKVRATAQQEFRQIFPRPGWVEHDPLDIWRSQLACARAAIRKAKLNRSAIAAIGIANQRETTLVWERSTGRPLCNAIVWQDRRTAAQCERFKRRGLAQRVRAKTGLVIDPYFSATKIAWILDNTSAARKQAQRGELAFGTVDAWLAWKLSGGRLHITDVTNAARTMLYDIHSRRWDKELLSTFRVPAALLPQVRRSAEVYGHTERRLFGAEIPIAGIAGDQQSALFGQACIEPGMAKNTYGTGCFMLLNTGNAAIRSRTGLIATAAASLDRPQFALEGSVFIAGAVVQWLRDALGIIKRSAEIEGLVRRVSDSGGVYFVPAFTGLGAPQWDPFARGTIIGLTRGTSAAHIARAALESIAFQSADVLAAMERDARLSVTELRVDGGASANDTLMQFQADLLGVPVVRPMVLETTALGAAYLAALATGLWKNLGEVSKRWKAGKRFEPK